MILMSITQKQILSVILIAVFVLLSYLLFKFFKANFKKGNESKMLSLNLVIKYKDFIKYLAYKETVNEDYAIYMVRINNFLDLTKKYSENIIKLYIRRVVKNLSVMLPYGGKLAQSKERNTFILYVPKVSGNEEEYALMLENAATTPFVYEQTKIIQTVSIGYSSSVSDYLIKLEEAFIALIASKRALGLITEYNNNLSKPDEKYFSLEKAVESALINVRIYQVVRTNVSKLEGYYFNIFINNKTFNNYLGEQPQKDSAWMNMYLISKTLNNIEVINYSSSKIYLPFILSSLEGLNFIDELNLILQSKNLSFNNIAVSIKNSVIKNRNNIIKNILQLKELGALISFEATSIDSEIYKTVEDYGINTVELYTNGNVLLEEELIELKNYANINRINTLLIASSDTYLNLCTHHTKEINDVLINEKTIDKKKWGR